MGPDPYQVELSILPQHLFRYPSEWDPCKLGKTKGGYLEGSIQLPKSFPGDLRIVISTFPGHNVKKGVGIEMVKRHPEIVSVHPTMIHVVRKAKGKQRLFTKNLYPMPSTAVRSSSWWRTH